MTRPFPIALAAALALVALAYLPAAFGNQYVWDDWDLFVFSRGLHDPALLWTTLFSPLLPETSYLRPAVLATFALEFRLWGLDHRLSHTVNLLLHLLNVALVGVIGRKLCRRTGFAVPWKPAAAAAFLYGIHPALVESAAWAAGRFDLMVTSFALASVLTYLSERTAVRVLGTAGFFFLAALSKESAIAIPMAMGLIYLALHQEQRWPVLVRELCTLRASAPFVAVLIAGIAYLGIRAVSLETMLHVDSRVAGELQSVSDRIGFAGQTLIHYLKASTLPFLNVSPQHPFDAGAMSGVTVAVGIGAFVSCCAGLIATLIWRRMELALLYAWVAGLLPVLNLLPITIGENIGHDRFLAMPLAFGCIAAGMLFSRAASGVDLPRTLKPVAIGVFALWSATSWVATKTSVPLWSSDLALWTWAYRKHPDSLYVSNNLAGTLVNANRYEEALKVLGERTTPIRLDREMNRARIQLKLGELQQAHETLDLLTTEIERLSARPNQESAGTGFLADRMVVIYRQTRAEIFLEQGDFDAAYRWADRLGEIGPRYAHTYRLKARALAGKGDWEGSDRELKTTLSLVPVTLQNADVQAYRAFLEGLCKSGQAAACERSSIAPGP